MARVRAIEYVLLHIRMAILATVGTFCSPGRVPEDVLVVWTTGSRRMERALYTNGRIGGHV